ncbi:MAG: hypothetical protein V1913_09245, partial [Fibrobacterota bacterium]
TCDIRRDTETTDAQITTLSHVTFQRPDRLFVENVTPVKRTIVADGTNFFSFIEGDPKGFSRPISQLNEEMLISLRKVPGTAMDHLLRLKGVPESDIDATEEFPVRKSYDAGKVYVILSLDREGRLARFEFYRSKETPEKTAQYDYSHFQEVLSGVWIPALHRLSYSQGGVDASESSRVDNLQANKPVDPGLFDASRYFKNVQFVSDFDEIYQPAE